MKLSNTALLLLVQIPLSTCFTATFGNKKIQRLSKSSLSETATDTIDTVKETRQKRKQALLQLLGGTSRTNTNEKVGFDPVLACPETKEPVRITTENPMLEGGVSGVKVTLRTSPTSGKTYEGRTDTFYNLLQSKEDIVADTTTDTTTENDVSETVKDVVNSLRVFIPPPLRMAGAMAGIDENYIPMRDLFTSPAVSFAYERGWRQSFASAGFPGADEEFEMVKNFFEPTVEGVDNSVVVDMSCATGLFTRRLADSGEYSRVLGCDYSESMLTEARRRIQSNPSLTSNKTRLELVRLDVGNIPMQSESINALHAGAAMHCWPEIDKGLSEIYRVLKPGGRFLASTFLSQYFSGVQGLENTNSETPITQQTFQYFSSTDELKDMMLAAGFEEEKIEIEVLGAACVIIKCEK